MEPKRSGHRSFLHGAAILGLAGVLCKVIGALYRIPLTNLIGVEAMGVYAKAYLIYSLLWVVSTSGLPVAVSRQVAALHAQEDPAGCESVFAFSRRLLGGIGGLFFMLMAAFSGLIAVSLGIPGGQFAVLCIAPCMLLTVTSAYRGYFQGLQQMVPTAVSQLIGSCGKLLIGLVLAAVFLPMGPAYAAGGALLGVTVSEAFALLYIHLRYRRARCPVSGPLPPAQTRPLREQLLRTALPITLGSAILPLTNILDAYLVTWCLGGIGYSPSHINTLYGVLSGMISSIINVPAVVTVSLSAALVPFISAAHAQGQHTKAASSVRTAMKLAFCVGLPCCAGMILLGEPILALFYRRSAAETAALARLIAVPGGTPFVFDALSVGGKMMQICGVSVLFLSISQTATGILQGTGNVLAPMRNTAIGAAAKVVLSLILLRIPQLNILGAPISSAVCYGIAALLNLISLRHITPLHKLAADILRPLAAAAAMAAVILLLRAAVSSALMHGWVILCVILGCAGIDLLLLLVLRVFSPQEVALFPGGKFLNRLVRPQRTSPNQTND